MPCVDFAVKNFIFKGTVVPGKLWQVVRSPRGLTSATWFPAPARGKLYINILPELSFCTLPTLTKSHLGKPRAAL